MEYAIIIGNTTVDASCYPADLVETFKIAGNVAARKITKVILAAAPATAITPLPNKTAQEVLDALADHAGRVNPGDTMIFAYAGHGGTLTTSVPFGKNYPQPATGTGFGTDDWESVIVLADRLLLANEYHNAMAAFKPGVNYINIIDACQAGSFYDLVVNAKANLFTRLANAVVSRAPADPIAETYALKPAVYDAIMQKPWQNLTFNGIHFAGENASSSTTNLTQKLTFSDAIFEATVTNKPQTWPCLQTWVDRDRLDGESSVLLPLGAADQAYLNRVPFAP